MERPKYRMIKSKFVVKVVGKSDDAVKRVQDILLDVDVEYHVPGGGAADPLVNCIARAATVCRGRMVGLQCRVE